MNRYYFFVLGICLVLIAGTSSAQTVKWDSTVRPGMYAGKVGQFKMFKHTTKDFIFLGNSITTYTDWDELLGLTNCKNRGIPGDITFGVLDRLNEVIDGKPAKVFILVGINDITRNIPDSVILNNYKRMITRLKKGTPKTKIYFQSIMPVNDMYAPMRGKADHIKVVDAQLKVLAAKEKITFIDLYPHFLNADGVMDPKLTFDGIHITDAGYRIWAKVLQDGGYLK